MVSLILAAVKKSVRSCPTRQKMWTLFSSHEEKVFFKIVRFELQSPAHWSKAVQQLCHVPEHVLMEQPQLGRCTHLRDAWKLQQIQECCFGITWRCPCSCPAHPIGFGRHFFTCWQSQAQYLKLLYITPGCICNPSALNDTKNYGASRYRARFTFSHAIRKKLELHAIK